MKITGNIAYKVFIILIVVIGLGAAGLSLTLAPQVRYAGCSEQSEQVEVVGKRIERVSSSGKHYHSITYIFIVAFAFPDGTTKELEIDSHTTRNSKEEVECSLYNSIYEGDKGGVIYKELKNIKEKYKERENSRYNGRLFISFEKDPDYGGLKIVANIRNVEPWQLIIMGVVLIGLIFLMVLAVKRNKRLGI